MLKQFAVSDEKKIRTLLEDIQLGDKKPSNFLNEMRALGGSKVSDELLKQIWLQRLPTQIRMIISTSTEELTNMAKMADKLLKIGDFSQINVMSTASSSQQRHISRHLIDNLEDKIDALTKRIDQIQSNKNTRNRSKSRTRDQTPNKPRFEKCWWHYKFGAAAKKCKKPCNFNSNSKN